MAELTPERLAEIRERNTALIARKYRGLLKYGGGIAAVTGVWHTLEEVVPALLAALDERDAEIARLRAEVGALRETVSEALGPEMVSSIAGNAGDDDGAREWMQRAVRAAHD